MRPTKRNRENDTNERRPRSAGLVLSGYELLRLGKSPLRAAMSRLMQPAFRLHYYRDLRERALRRALCLRGCGLRPGSADDTGIRP